LIYVSALILLQRVLEHLAGFLTSHLPAVIAIIVRLSMQARAIPGLTAIQQANFVNRVEIMRKVLAAMESRLLMQPLCEGMNDLQHDTVSSHRAHS
jgi:hypothetical protein